VFVTVVEAGSFAGAARRLGRATSVISYTVTNLEAQLGLSLFDRDGTRRPLLTEAGQMVLLEARSVASGVDGLKAKVQGLLQGLEAEVRLAIDAMFPERWLAGALREFRQTFPEVRLRLQTEALEDVPRSVMDGSSTIGVRGPPGAEVQGLERIAIGSVPLTPVAAPTHALACRQNPAHRRARDHLQIILSSRSALAPGESLSGADGRTWRVGELATQQMLLREGVGWGLLPLPSVAADLAAGRLVGLRLPEVAEHHYPFFAIHRTDTPPGPAASRLLDCLADESHR
jgi:DNA-binding transcriptional LysR family regulator